jgi:hypothetical protein
MLPPRNTPRPSAPLARHALGRGERARACGTLVSFIQLHKRCTERLPNTLDGRLLQYPYGISLFPLALNTWAFNSFIITINGPRPIYLTNISRVIYCINEMSRCGGKGQNPEARAHRCVDMVHAPQATGRVLFLRPGSWCATSTGPHRARRIRLLHSSRPRGWRVRNELIPHRRATSLSGLWGSLRGFALWLRLIRRPNSQSLKPSTIRVEFLG